MRSPAFVFDFGNVVAYFDYCRFYDRLGARLSRSGESVRAQLRDAGFAKLHVPFESGLITPAAFAEGVTAGLGMSLPFEEFVRDFEDIFWLNEPVSRLLASLDSQGHTLILGSNTNALHAPFYRREFAATLDRFDAFVLSHEVGCMKPDARFYNACVQAAGVAPGSCVFIDDLAENIEGARAAGLQGLHYVDHDSLCEELRRLGIEIAAGEG